MYAFKIMFWTNRRRTLSFALMMSNNFIAPSLFWLKATRADGRSRRCAGYSQTPTAVGERSAITDHRFFLLWPCGTSSAFAAAAASRPLIFLLYFFSYCTVDANVRAQLVAPPEESGNVDASLSPAC